MPTTYVLGLGNVLMSDDGLGPAVLHAFEEQYVVGTDVSVVDLGTPGLDLSPWLADAENVVLIDTVKAPLPPGSLRLYKRPISSRRRTWGQPARPGREGNAARARARQRHRAPAADAVRA
jgi:hydrogenase maturation protease